MDYGLAKRYTIDVIARLSGADQNRPLEADALEHVLGVAEEVRWARDVAERLRFRLNRLTAALQEAERLGCRCDPDAGLLCRMHALVQDALDVDGGRQSRPRMSLPPGVPLSRTGFFLDPTSAGKYSGHTNGPLSLSRFPSAQ
jgi:hypothetical protein